MTCPCRWSDPHGEHTCRHLEGHEKRRHTCECGSWMGARESITLTPRTTTCAERSPAGDSGGSGRDLTVRPEHVAT